MDDFKWQQRQERWAQKQARWAERQARHQARWAQKQERWARKQANWSGSPAHGIMLSIAIIAVGAFFLLDNLGLIRFHDVLRYWPVLLIALGTVRLVDSHGSASIVWGGILAGVGGLLLLDNLNIIYFDWRIFWPAVVIGVGILMLIRTTQWWDGGGPTGSPDQPGGAPAPSQPGHLNLFAMFHGEERRVDAQDFRGGAISAMFGGCDVDLREAAMAEGNAAIEVNVMFGGAEIQIPNTWLVDLRGVGLFGGFSDETQHPPEDASANPPRLTVTGYAMFGGVSVTN